jgi:CRISPR-associated protein Csd2
MNNTANETKLNRGTGLLLIEVVNSNPNGDPDRESDPRTRLDACGEISPVSFKRKIRNLVENKEGPVWKDISSELGLDADNFDILESKDTKRDEVNKLSLDGFLKKYWDARVFGATYLEKKKKNISFIKTGVVQFGLGVSLSPVQIERMTTTKVFAVEEDKDKGMAPLGFRVVSYGVYTMPFFVNATAAQQTNCTPRDIELLLRLIPYAYTQSASYIRPQVNIRNAFYAEHNNPRGTFSDFRMIELLTPQRIGDNTKPATSWKDYDEKQMEESLESFKTSFEGKYSKIEDLMEKM